jgi:predicted DNA-binding antitoxin AbrB/MazE fold protein
MRAEAPSVKATLKEGRLLVNKRLRGYSSIMTTIVDAIYENGKLVLQQPLPLPEHAHVRVTVESDLERVAWLKHSEESLKKVWDNDADDIFNELLEK